MSYMMSRLFVCVYRWMISWEASNIIVVKPREVWWWSAHGLAWRPPEISVCSPVHMKFFHCRTCSIFILLSPGDRGRWKGKVQSHVYEEWTTWFQKYVPVLLLPRAAVWQGCSTVSQVCGFVPSSAVWIWAVLTGFRYVRDSWGPRADTLRKIAFTRLLNRLPKASGRGSAS